MIVYCSVCLGLQYSVDFCVLYMDVTLFTTLCLWLYYAINWSVMCYLCVYTVCSCNVPVVLQESVVCDRPWRLDHPQ